MKISITGIVVDQFGSVLAIKRYDTRTWAPPGGSLDPDELPTDGTAREVEEETGLKVYPVRLVSLHKIHINGNDHLGFVFRCLLRGGNIKTSAESLDVGYIPPGNLDDVRMATFHRNRIKHALNHPGGAPTWNEIKLSSTERIGTGLLKRIVYPYKNIKRRIRKQEAYIPPVSWRVSTAAVIRDENGAVLWRREPNSEQWTLPGGVVADARPWSAIVSHVQAQTGLTVRPTDLAAVYVLPDNHLHLLWLADITGGTPAANSAWHALATPPATTPHWLERTADATNPHRATTQFKRQSML